MSELSNEVIEHLEETIEERANSKSRQPRYNNPQDIFTSTRLFVNKIAKELPPYGTNTRDRDLALIRLAHSEPYLVGIINSVVQIDINRRWSVTGAKSQVSRLLNRFENFENGLGWRTLIGRMARSYYNTDTGYVAEVVRVGGEFGAMEQLNSIDSTRVQLQANVDRPLIYSPIYGNTSYWKPHWFIQDSSMISTLEELGNIGFCAVSRCAQLAQLMMGIYEHNKELLDFAPERGFVWTSFDPDTIRKGIQLIDVDTANRGGKFIRDVIMLYNTSEEDFIKQLALSKLPENFNMSEWVEVLMKAYSLEFGYSVDEFYTVSSGNFGRGNEASAQMEQSTTKGELDFPNSFVSRFRPLLPKSAFFEFEERNDEGDLIRAEISKTYAETVQILYELRLGSEQIPILTREQALTLLVKYGLIPSEWSEFVEDVDIDSSNLIMDREESLEREEVRSAIENFPYEPIIKTNSDGKVKVLWESGNSAIKRYWKLALEDRSMSSLAASVRAAIVGYFTNQLSRESFDISMEGSIDREYRRAWDEGMGIAGILPDEYTQQELAVRDELIENELAFIPNLANQIEIARDNPDASARAFANNHAPKWASKYDKVKLSARVMGGDNPKLRWVMSKNPEVEHCEDCPKLDGQVRRASVWQEHNLIAGVAGSSVECGEYEERCTFEETGDPISKGRLPKLKGLASV